MNLAKSLDSLAVMVIFIITSICQPSEACLFSKHAVKQNEKQPYPFNHTNFIVRFNPYVSKHDDDDTYTEDDLLPMVSLISTKFSSVLAPRIGIRDERDSLAHVAPAVAKFNRKHEGTSQTQLKVFMSFELDSNANSFDSVHTIAERANSIFPGTVEYILLQQQGLGEHNSHQVRNLLIDVEGKLTENEENSSRPIYKLGALFPLSACGGDGENVASYLAPLLNHLDLVVFHLWPGRENYLVGVEETVADFTEEFSRCKAKVLMMGMNLSVEVAFRTRWPDTDFEGNRNFSNLISFWGKMNDWAVKNNTKLFMMDAFDNPHRKNPTNVKHQGWWRLVKRSPHGSFLDDVFEDKMEAARKNGETGGVGVGFKLLLISITIPTVLLVLVCFGGLILYWKVTRKIEGQRNNLLSKKECNEFFHGSANKRSRVVTREGEGGGGSPEEIISSLAVIAYNSEYELERKAFTFDETSILGTGNFGVVYRGRVHKGIEEINVAVKTLKNEGSSVAALKDFLTEIKTQSYLGQHENIVSLVGAYTQELRKGRVYVLTEICERGSLEKHLKGMVPRRYSEAPGFRETAYLGNLEPGQSSVSGGGGKSGQQISKDLYRWSCEIASGMEFLASKHVVHADLATRNVLLTKKLTAKVCDFGLSRRLYDYQSYVKSQQGPLPWKSLAPESLCRGEFNEKSDVWAYGITLWEIYSLGEQPYPGLSWTADYATQLENGLRPDKPRYNADDMYTTMHKCWNIDPARRPTFRELKYSLKMRIK